MICNLNWNAVIGVTDNSQSSTVQGNQMVAGSSLPGKSMVLRLHCCLCLLVLTDFSSAF